MATPLANAATAPAPAPPADPAAGRSLWAPPGRTALLVGTGGVLLRAALMLVHVPPTNSDEGTMGLAALHIARGGHPVWMYGQDYMAALDAYLAAPLIGGFGPHTVLLRLPELGLFAALLVLAYRLTRALYPPWLAVTTVALLSLGADRVVKNELIAAGGYPEILPMAALLMLLSVRLAGTPAVGGHRRRWAFACWGLVAGLCLWADWLVLPYLAAAAAVLVWGCHRELRRAPGALLAAGTVLGAAPLILYNLSAAPGANSIAVYARVSGPGTGPLGGHLYGSTLLGIPLATGLCQPSHCAPPVQGWGVAYLVLLVVATVMAVRALRREAGPGRSRQVGRLALLAAAALTYLAYLRSAGSVDSPVESARYLHCLLLSTPAVLWPLWTVAATHRSGDGAVPAGRRWVRLPARLALVALLSAGTVATVALVADVPRYQRTARRQQELIAALDRLGATRVYSDYWTCDRIAFATGERVTCAVLDNDLAPGLDRYRPYRFTVAGAAAPVWAFPAGSPADTAFAHRIAADQAAVTTVDAAGYHLYLLAGGAEPR